MTLRGRRFCPFQARNKFLLQGVSGYIYIAERWPFIYIYIYLYTCCIYGLNLTWILGTNSWQVVVSSVGKHEDWKGFKLGIMDLVPCFQRNSDWMTGWLCLGLLQMSDHEREWGLSSDKTCIFFSAKPGSSARHNGCSLWPILYTISRGFLALQHDILYQLEANMQLMKGILLELITRNSRESKTRRQKWSSLLTS